MNYVSLELFKKHVRADDFNADDEQLRQYLDAAEQQVIMATNRTEDELVEMGGGVFPRCSRKPCCWLRRRGMPRPRIRRACSITKCHTALRR